MARAIAAAAAGLRFPVLKEMPPIIDKVKATSKIGLKFKKIVLTILSSDLVEGSR
jgi:hypothetical protein